MTPRTAAQNETLRIATRTRILDGALKVFGNLGFDGASVRRIAAEAGVAQGLLYSHFSGKEELLKAIFERGMDDVRESFRAAAGDDSRPPLERLIRSSFAILRRNLGFWRLTYGIRMQPSVLQALGPDLGAWTGDILKTLEAHFRATGAERPALEAAILFAAIDGISQHFALDPEHYPLDAIADELIAKHLAPARPPVGRTSATRSAAGSASSAAGSAVGKAAASASKKSRESKTATIGADAKEGNHGNHESRTQSRKNTARR